MKSKKFRAFGLFRYVGGKRKVASEIVDRILEQCVGNSPTGYCEPFVGAGAVCLSLLRSSVGETIERVWLNDLDKGCAALWWCVLHEPDELLRLVHQFEPSRELFFEFKRDFLEGREFSLVELGLRKLAVQQMSFSGMGVMAGGPLRKIGSRWSPRCIERNVREARRLLDGKQVTVTSLDFREVLSQVDRDTFVYADPPYMVPGGELYQHAFNQRDHEELQALLAGAKFRWLLSYDDCPQIRNMYCGDSIDELQMTYSDKGRRSRNPRKRELLITPTLTNFDVAEQFGVERPTRFNGPGDMCGWPRPFNVCDHFRV
jgi:DNA adenine methylase